MDSWWQEENTLAWTASGTQSLKGAIMIFKDPSPNPREKTQMVGSLPVVFAWVKHEQEGWAEKLPTLLYMI